MPRPLTLTCTTGRTGTSFLHHAFGQHPRVVEQARATANEDIDIDPGTRGVVYHEGLAAPNRFGAAHWHRSLKPEARSRLRQHEAVDKMIRVWGDLTEVLPVTDFGWTGQPLVPLLADLFPDRLRVLILHRHPVAVAASLTVRGFYTINTSPVNALTPHHPQAIFRNYRDRWDQFSPFEKALWRWLEMTADALDLQERLPDVPFLVMASEDLFADPDQHLARVAELTQLPPPGSNRSREKNRSRKSNLETLGLGKEWQQYDRFPELNDLAESLGYDMSPATVESIVSRYLLPTDWGARARRLTRFWGVKRRIIRVLTRLT